MIIKKLNLISFGKFKDKTIELNDGFNAVSGDNEAGKSTLAGFIYAMLYGFGSSRKKGINFRDRYSPWDGSAAEGSMEIESEGRLYTVYRKCGSSKRNDVFKVFDSDSGEELSELPGELSAIGEDTYEKTLYIKQAACLFEGSTEEITAKLSNLSDTGDENVSFEKALKILDAMRRRIQLSRGSGGELAVINQRLCSLADEKHASEKKQTELGKLREQLSNARNELTKAKKLYNECCMGDDSAELQNAAVIIEKKKRCIALKERKDDLLSDYRKTLLNYNKLKKFEEVPCRSFGIKSTVMGLISVFIGIALAAAVDARLILLSFFGALWLTFGGVQHYIYLKNLKSVYGTFRENELKEKQNEAIAASAECDSAQLLYSNVYAEYETAHSELKKCIDEFAAKYGYDPEGTEDVRKRISSERKQAHINLIALSEEVSAIETKLSCAGEPQFEANAAEVSALTQRRSELTHFYDSIGLSVKALTEARRKMQQNFAPTLNYAASEYFSEITGGKYSRLFTDGNLKINVDSGIPRSGELFSGGTVDQMYLSLRLALTDMMFGNSKVPLILDQPFTQYDKKRRKNAEKLLYRLSDKRQIILFTENDNIFSDIKPTEILT